MREGQNIARARRLRRAETLPERRAWAVLRRFRKFGWPVRRQHPIGGLTVDFAIVTAKIVIEVDGPLHLCPKQSETDNRRDLGLRKAGWKVLRFSDVETLDSEGLFVRIAEELALEGYRREPSPPAPLPQAGEGK